MAVLPFLLTIPNSRLAPISVAVHIFAASLLNSGADPSSNSRTNKRLDSKECCCKTRVASSHSNPKILKTNRRSRYCQLLSPYDEQDDGGGCNDFDWDDDNSFSDVETALFCQGFHHSGLTLLLISTPYD